MRVSIVVWDICFSLVLRPAFKWFRLVSNSQVAKDDLEILIPFLSARIADMYHIPSLCHGGC